MLLGYNTWSMPTLGIDQTVAHLAGLGYDSLELTICPGWPTDAALLDGAGAAADQGADRRAWVAADRLHRQCAGAGGRTSLWAANRRQLERCLDFAAELRDGDARRFTSAPPAGWPEGGDPASAWEGCKHLLVARFGELAEYAAGCGAMIHIEPHVLTAVRRTEQARWLLDQVGSEALRVTLDISHFEVQAIAAAEVVAALAPVMRAVEVKDERGVYPDFEFLIPGEGEMDYAGFLRILAAAGFDGSVSVEISKFRQAVPGYDPLSAAAQSYRVLAAAFESAEVTRG